MEQFHCEAVVIGAGVVGLAIGQALARAGHETLILEKNSQFGMETSARNSEVIHAGLYYPKDSLKARFCVRGRDQLYDFAARRGVPHRRLGKWLVAAAPANLAQLAAIQASASANGVTDLAPVPAATIRSEEPDLQACEVLTSPSTGIIDSHAYMLALLGVAESHGAQLVRDAEAIAVARDGDRWRVIVNNRNEQLALTTRLVVNSAGLWSHAMAARIEGLAPAFVPPLCLAKGNYAAWSGRAPFRRLIYPMPEPGGLGVHWTLDLAGQGRLGPDVEWLDSNDPAQIDYNVRPDIPALFASRARSWWPGVDAARLAPAYSGVRPKLAPGSHASTNDFRIDGPAVHGLAGLVNLLGIESPALAASLAIADHVVELLRDE
jgi:L-2-hydroxyglutarate oxidase LhgO